VPLFKALCKTLSRVYLCHKQPASSFLINDIIALEDFLDSIPFNSQPTSYPISLVYILRISAYIIYQVTFVCFGISSRPAGSRLGQVFRAKLLEGESKTQGVFGNIKVDLDIRVFCTSPMHANSKISFVWTQFMIRKPVPWYGTKGSMLRWYFVV
jgi:hypothetical protein